jgi:hypothetical protein
MSGRAFSEIVYAVLHGREFRMVAGIIAFVAWIAGILYCDRVAEELDLNPWIARVSGVLLPIVGPGIYWFLRARFRAKEHLGRGQGLL